MTIEKLQSDLMFEGRVFDVRRDKVRFPDGHITDLDIVLHRGAVTIVPVDRNGHVWFVYQYRHAVNSWLLELPAGTLEDEESPIKCAQREIQEEIGLAAGQLNLIGEFFLAPGYSTEHMYVYLATELQPEPLPPDRDELLQIRNYPIKDVLSMAISGKIIDAKSLAALWVAKTFLNV